MIKNKEVMDWIVEYYKDDYLENIEEQMSDYGEATVIIHELHHEFFDFDIEINIYEGPIVIFEMIFKNIIQNENALNVISTINQISRFAAYFNDYQQLVLKEEFHRVETIKELHLDLERLEISFHQPFLMKKLNQILNVDYAFNA